jgi:hypothetical protein
MLSILASILFTITPKDTTFVKVNVSNKSTIQTIQTRDVLFGVKETVEELFSNEGYSPVDSSQGFDAWVSIDSIYSPQQTLNIIGTKWLRKDYIVNTTICIGSGCYNATGKRSTFIFAMFLNVENDEVPLNRKAFSKALQESLRENMKFKNKQPYYEKIY